MITALFQSDIRSESEDFALKLLVLYHWSSYNNIKAISSTPFHKDIHKVSCPMWHTFGVRASIKCSGKPVLALGENLQHWWHCDKQYISICVSLLLQGQCHKPGLLSLSLAEGSFSATSDKRIRLPSSDTPALHTHKCEDQVVH